MVLMFLFLPDIFTSVGENRGEIKWGKGREEKLQYESPRCPTAANGDERGKTSHFQFQKKCFEMHTEKLHLKHDFPPHPAISHWKLDLKSIKGKPSWWGTFSLRKLSGVTSAAASQWSQTHRVGLMMH